MLALLGLATAGADEPSGPEGDHLVLSRVPASANAQAVTLVRINGAGTSDGSNWALPTTASGTNKRFTLEGDSNAVGALARSADGRYVTLAGYTAATGATLGNSSDTVPRVVARVDSLGNVDTSTTLGTSFTQEKIRGAVTNDGSGFWVTGHGNTANPKGGMVYAALGSTTPTVLFTKDSGGAGNSAWNNTRTVQIGGGNVYFGSEKGTAGIYRLNGLPKTAQTPISVAAFGADGSGPTSLALLSDVAGGSTINLMYVVRETDGIYKFSSNGSSWTNRGEVVNGAFNGVVAKVDSAGDYRLYAISGGNAANSVVTLTDTAAFNAAPTATATKTVATAAAGTAYRGIAFAPRDETLEVPGTPTGVSGTAGNAKVTLSWTAPSSGSPITGYEITPYVSGVAQTAVLTGSTATSHTVEGLTNGTAYTFTVAAINKNGTGTASAQSAALTPQAPAVAPANTAPPVASGKVAIGHPLACTSGTWTGSPEPVLSYAWLRDGVPIGGALASTYTTVPADAGAAIGCEVTAANSAGSAAATSNTIEMPAPGLFCAGIDVNGSGSALQSSAHATLWGPGFPGQICPGGPEVGYDATSDAAALAAWSADGLSGALDTDVAFLGTDQAPSAAQIANVKAAAGPGVQLAVVPVAQTSIAVIANLPAGCTVEEITSGNLTAVFEGRLRSWSELATAEGSCGSPITRVVPSSAEAVSAQFKNYLFQLNKKALACAPGGATWEGLGQLGTVWPESCGAKALSPVVRPAAAGAAAVVGTVDATAGAIGFATLADAEAGNATVLALQNNGFAPAAEATFASPSAGAAANCWAMTYRRPAGGGGLDLDWSGVYGAKPAIGSGAYPLCMLTYVLAFHGYEAAGFGVGTGATVKDYVNGYVVTTAGQAALEGSGYAPLPAAAAAQFDVLGEARKAAGKITR